MNFYAEGKYVHRPFIDRAELLDRVTTVVVGLNTILVIVVIGVFIRSYATVNHINLKFEENDFFYSDLMKMIGNHHVNNKL